MLITSFARGFWNVELTPSGFDNRPSIKKEDMMASEQAESHTEARALNLSNQFIYGVTGTVYMPGLILEDKDKNTN